LQLRTSCYLFFSTLILTLSFLTASGQKINYGNVDSLKAKRKNSFLISPLVGYQQETRFAFGIASAYIFKTNRHDTLLRTSTIPTGILYTQNDQLIIGVGGNIYMPKEKYIIKFEGTFSKFPDKFWGLGNFTHDNKLERYTFTQFFINPQLHRKVLKNLFIGLAWDFQRVYNIGYEHINPLNNDTSSFITDNVPGVNGRSQYQVSGVDLFFTFDSRNHAYCPDKGGLARLKMASFNEFLGGNYNFQVVELDLRRFIKTHPKHVLALQALGTFTFGEVPYRSLAALGGNSIMRGYYGGRFRDKMIVVVQAEYRFPLFWRFSGVGFVSFGQVMDKFSTFSMANFHTAFGPGIRISLLRKEKLNLRVDLGITEKFNFQPYVTLAESF
jgi:hypothetical protein